MGPSTPSFRQHAGTLQTTSLCEARCTEWRSSSDGRCPALEVHFGDNLEIISRLPDASFELIYIDPPFNTGTTQARTQIRTLRDEAGDRVGFKGQRYRTIQVGTKAYGDSFSDYLGFLEPRLDQARRLLTPTGSFFLHINYREVHYCKVLLHRIFGRASFINEIIWAYDYGARATRRWPAKHDNILWYAKDPDRYTFRYADIDRIPYMAPGLVGPEKAARGKTPTDTWWQTIVSPTGKEKTGYPTQKPLAILTRIVKVHSNPGDRVLDFFAGSGTTSEAAIRLGRSSVMVDNNPEAIAVMVGRFAPFPGVRYLGCERLRLPPGPNGFQGHLAGGGHDTTYRTDSAPCLTAHRREADSSTT
jgi:site-specific DNA-methyltransferase (adenine-specific)